MPAPLLSVGLSLVRAVDDDLGFTAKKNRLSAVFSLVYRLQQGFELT